MKNLKVLAVFFLFTGMFCNGYSQGFIPPAEGNAAVYFVRATNYGGTSSFEYFRDTEFIGIFKGKNYMRFEYPAGKQLYWASSENKKFLDCDLKAGEIYIVLVNIQVGAWKAQVGLEPILPDNPDFERVKGVVNKKPPVVTPPSTIKLTTAKLKQRGFVENIMNRYEMEWKNSRHTQVISPDMAVPLDLLK